MSHFFIDRPIFATVLSIVIVIVGAGGAARPADRAVSRGRAADRRRSRRPIPGANAKVVADTVATPIEQEVNGVENMLYMSSKCTNDGQMNLDVTFELGTNLDMAQVLVQNRVAIAEAKLPEEVKRQGVTTKKKSPSILLCVNLISPDGSRYDQLYLSNYATLSVKDDLARIKGVGDVTFLGAARLQHARLARPGEAGVAQHDRRRRDRARIREQNVQVAAGRLGQPPTPAGPELPAHPQHPRPAARPKSSSATSSSRPATTVGHYLSDVVADDRPGQKGVELGAKNYDVNSYLDGEPSVTLAVFQLPGSNALDTAEAIRAKMEELKADVSRRASTTASSTTRRSSSTSRSRASTTR